MHLKPYRVQSSSEILARYSRCTESSAVSSESDNVRSGNASTASPRRMSRAANNPQPPPTLLLPTRTVVSMPPQPRAVSQREKSCSCAFSSSFSGIFALSCAPKHCRPVRPCRAPRRLIARRRALVCVLSDAKREGACC